MHEVGLIQQVIDLVEDYAEREHAGVIRSVKMRVGDLSGAVPDSLTFAFGIVRRDTVAKDAELIIEREPVICFCCGCDKEFMPSGAVYECPICGTLSVQIMSGRSLQVVSIEVD